jgi:hypothetical protein
MSCLFHFRAAVRSLAAVSLSLCACGKIRNAPDRVLSDDDLRAMAAASFDPGRMMNRSFSVGRHHGIPVRVDFPCGDVCPDYTTKVVHYDMDPAMCPPGEGEILSVGVPSAASVMLREFCFPRILHVQGAKR